MTINPPLKTLCCTKLYSNIPEVNIGTFKGILNIHVLPVSYFRINVLEICSFNKIGIDFYIHTWKRNYICIFIFSIPF